VNGKLSYVSIEEKLRYSRSVVRWQGSKLQQGLFFVSIKSRNLEIFARGWRNMVPEPGLKGPWSRNPKFGPLGKWPKQAIEDPN
jgi:hypothetical protein